MKRLERLQAILDHIETIETYCNQCGISDLNGFVSNPMAMDACITHIGHIGEQMGRLHEEDPHLFDSFPDVNPTEIRSMRNRLFHDYQGIINDIVWEVIEDDLPKLKNTVQSLLNEDIRE